MKPLLESLTTSAVWPIEDPAKCLIVVLAQRETKVRNKVESKRLPPERFITNDEMRNTTTLEFAYERIVRLAMKPEAAKQY